MFPVLGIAKFLAHMPLGFVGIRAVQVFIVIRKHHDLQPPNFDLKLYTGAGIIGVVGLFTFIWNFITWIPACIPEPGPIVASLAIFDFMLAVLLFVGIGFQSTYVPPTIRSCADAYTWQGRPYNQSYYALLGRYNQMENRDGTKFHWDARGQCKSAVTVWWVTIIAAVLYLVGSSLCLVTVLSGRSSHPATFKRRRRNGGMFHRLSELVKSIGRGVRSIGATMKSKVPNVKGWWVRKQVARQERHVEAGRKKLSGTELEETASMMSTSPSLFKARIEGNIKPPAAAHGSPHLHLDLDTVDLEFENPPAYQQVLLDDSRRV